MNTNIMAHAQPATISEQQLFAEFAAGTISDNKQTTPVANYFTGYGETDRLTTGMAAAFADILASEAPSDTLAVLKLTLKGALEEIEFAEQQFEAVKFERLLETVAGQPPRYSAPEAA